MRYNFTSAANQTIAASTTAPVFAIDASANAVVTLETLELGGRSASASDLPAICQISRNIGGSISGGTAATIVAEESSHTAAIRATVLVGNPTVTGGTETIIKEIPFPVQGLLPLGVPGIQVVAKTQPGEILVVRVVQPGSTSSVDFRVSGTIQD